MNAALPWVILAVTIVAALVYGERQWRARIAAQADVIILKNWLHYNLRAIRAQVAYVCPEAESVCNSLETALPGRCAVDLVGLERHLMALRRCHNEQVAEGAAALLVRADNSLDAVGVGRAAPVRVNIADYLKKGGAR